MAFNAFLKIDGIPGESNDKVHKNEIEVLSFSWGLSNSSSGSSSGGGGAGKASFQDFSFTSSTQSSSPLLALSCASGKHLPSALLTLRKGGAGGGIEFVKINLQDVLVSSYSEAGDANGSDDRPTDAVSLNFGRIEFDYFPQAAGGTTAQPIVFSWDLAQNKG